MGTAATFTVGANWHRFGLCRQARPAQGAHDPALMSTNHTMVKARLDDRIGVAAVTYVLFGVKLGPGLALTLVLVFVWSGDDPRSRSQ